MPYLIGLVSLVGCHSNVEDSRSLSDLAKQVAQYAKEHGEQSPEIEGHFLGQSPKVIGTYYHLILKTDNKDNIIIQYIDSGSDNKIGENDSLVIGQRDRRFIDVGIDGFHTYNERRNLGKHGATELARFFLGNDMVTYEGLGTGSDETVSAINKEYKDTLKFILDHLLK